ncbi:MAG: phytanoyl-CoA dioxygenase family protein [Phycisphaeraceae bacterium]
MSHMPHQPEKWKTDYERDGYLVVENLLDESTLATLRGEIEKITADPDALPQHLRKHVQLERDYLSNESQQKYNELGADQVGNAVRNIMELPLFSPALGELICYEPLLDVLEALFESPEFHFHNYKCIVKAPKVGSTFRWHRDLPYLYHTSPNLITAMLCLDPMTEENGATVVLPGTHRLPTEEVERRDVEIQEQDLPTDAERVTVTCPAGSAVLFHVSIIHGGGPNRSEIPRRNVIGIWAGPDAWPITPNRYAYGELHPRSQDPIRQKQVQMTFPRLFQNQSAAP